MIERDIVREILLTENRLLLRRLLAEQRKQRDRGEDLSPHERQLLHDVQYTVDQYEGWCTHAAPGVSYE